MHKSGYYSFKLIFSTILLFSFIYGCNLVNNRTSIDLEDFGLYSKGFSMSKSSVKAGDTFTITASIKNETDNLLILTSNCTSFYFQPDVYKDDQRLLIASSGGGCFQAITEHRLFPGDDFTQIRTVRASARVQDPETEELITAPLEPGEYTLRLKSNIIKINGDDATTEFVEKTFRVR